MNLFKRKIVLVRKIIRFNYLYISDNEFIYMLILVLKHTLSFKCKGCISVKLHELVNIPNLSYNEILY